MKKLLLVLLAVAMVFSFAACGGEGSPAVEEGSPAVEEGSPATAPEAEENDAYTLENGVLTTANYSLTLPEGWIVSADATDEDRATLYKCATEEEFDPFSNASVTLYISAMTVEPERDVAGEYTDSNKQLFDGGEPTVEDITIGEYSGSKMTGAALGYTGSKQIIINVQKASYDGNMFDNLVYYQLKGIYFADAEADEVQAIFDSVQILIPDAE